MAKRGKTKTRRKGGVGRIENPHVFGSAKTLGDLSNELGLLNNVLLKIGHRVHGEIMDNLVDIPDKDHFEITLDEVVSNIVGDFEERLQWKLGEVTTSIRSLSDRLDGIEKKLKELR